MSEESNGKFKYLRILVFLVCVSLVAFSFLCRPQSLRFRSYLLNSDPTQLSTTGAVPAGGETTEDSDFQRSVAVLTEFTESNLYIKGDLEARSTPTVKIISDSLSVRDNTSRSLPGGVSAARKSSSENQREWEWRQAMVKRFFERRYLLKEKCESYNNSIPSSVRRLLRDAFLYSRKYKLLTCICAKGGASSWRTHFLKMTSYKKYIRSAHQPGLENKIVAAEFMDRFRLYRRMHHEDEETVRVISVRHPFSRLVSAYTDKFSNGSLRAPFKIRISMFTPVLKIMGEPIDPRHRVAVPFTAFLRGVVEENRRGKVGMNRHWRPYSSTCRPCHIPYEYIVKLETFEEDLRYLVLKLGIEEIDVTTQRNRSKPKNAPTYEAYFRDVPDDVIVQVYSIYEQDFYLFSYEVPQFVKDALNRMGSRK